MPNTDRQLQEFTVISKNGKCDLQVVGPPDLDQVVWVHALARVQMCCGIRQVTKLPLQLSPAGPLHKLLYSG